MSTTTFQLLALECLSTFLFASHVALIALVIRANTKKRQGTKFSKELPAVPDEFYAPKRTATSHVPGHKWPE